MSRTSAEVTAELELDRAVDSIYGILKKAYAYLLDRAAAKGHWDETRSTALAAMALQPLFESDSRWVRLVREHLENTQSAAGPTAGSWGQEVWDSAMAILALKALGASSRDVAISNGLRWIADLYSANGRGNWHDEPWETSWAVIAILNCGIVPDGVDLDAATRWLLSLQDESGRLVAPHYTAYFVLIDHELSKVSLEPRLRQDLRDPSALAVRYLKETAKADPLRLWTSEAWSNGQILWCLGRSGTLSASDPFLGAIVSWFEQHQEPAGNWSDIEDTASAVLGLLTALEIMNSAGGGGANSLRRELRRRMPQRRLAVGIPVFEYEKDTGCFSIHLSRRLLKVLSLIGLVATAAATLVTLLDFGCKHWLT